jgi:outer membrane cobalamin receptor
VTLLVGRAHWAAPVLIALALSANARDASGQVTAIVDVTVRTSSPGSEESRPIVGAAITIAASGLSASTDADGRAIIRGLVPGTHSFTVSAFGFETLSVAVDVTNGRRTSLALTLPSAPVAVEGLEVLLSTGGLPPGGVAIATAELDAAVLDLPSAIDRVPGATVVRQGGPGAPAVVQLRGSSASQVLVLLDGVEVNSPVTGVADLSTIDLEGIAHIVVLPGTQSARYGPRALGGVVLLTSRRVTGSTLSMMAGAGSWSSGEFAANGSTALTPDWSVAGGAQWTRSDGDFIYAVPDFRGGGEAPRLNANHERLGADLRVSRQGRVDASLRTHGSVLERGSPGAVAQPSMTGAQRHERYGASLDASAGSSTRRIAAVVSTQWQLAEYNDSAPPFGQAYEARTDVRQGRITLDASQKLGSTTLRGGVAATRLDVESSALLTDPTLVVDELGGWLRAERDTEVGAGVTLLLSGGARLDKHDLVDGTTVSPSANLSLSRRGTSLDVGWGYGFAPPGLGDLFFQEGVLVEPNPELRPERVRNEVTVSLSQRWRGPSGEVELRATAYDADVDDMILWFPDFRFVWSPVNFDVARRGLELSGAFERELLGHRHSLSGSAAWSNVEYRGPTLTGQVAYRPEFTADASLTLALGVASLTPSVRHVGERRSAAGSELNVLEAYDLVDVGLRLPFDIGGARARLDVTLSNVLDERAALLVDYPLPGRGWSTRLRLFPNR